MKSKTTPTWDRTAKAHEDINFLKLAYKNVFNASDMLRLERIRDALPNEANYAKN